MQDTLCLIDTSVWIEVFPPRRASSQTLVQHVEALIQSRRAATTGMVRLELLAGARTLPEYRELEDALIGLPTLPIEEHLWDEACKLSFQFKRVGVTVPISDLVITTIAIHANATVLHRDRHFDMIAAHTPLRVEGYLP